MKRTPLTLLVLCFLILSCKKDESVVNNPAQEFAVRVDSVSIQKPAIQSDTLRGRVWATLGPTTCYRFSRFEKISGDSFNVRIKVFGLQTQSSSCGQTVQKLTGAIYRVFPIYPGKFRFVVEQPDGSTRIDSIVVI